MVQSNNWRSKCTDPYTEARNNHIVDDSVDIQAHMERQLNFQGGSIKDLDVPLHCTPDFARNGQQLQHGGGGEVQNNWVTSVPSAQFVVPLEDAHLAIGKARVHFFVQVHDGIDRGRELDFLFLSHANHVTRVEDVDASILRSHPHGRVSGRTRGGRGRVGSLSARTRGLNVTFDRCMLRHHL